MVNIKYSRKHSKHTLYTRKRKGGSYPAPIRATDIPLRNDYAVKYICSHGEISPDVFYTIPPNTYLLFPNICGVSTSTRDTIVEPIFTDLHTANDIFTQKFITGKLLEKGTNFTVFVPGDIIPMQTFIFSPTIGIPKLRTFNMGFVGVFNPAALENNYIYKTIKLKRVDDSMFTLTYPDGLILVYNLLNYFRTYLKNNKINSGPLYSIYINICYEILKEKRRTEIRTQDLIDYDIRNIILYPYNYGKNTFQSSKFDYEALQIQIIDILKYIRILLPLLRQNNISDLLAKRIIDKFRETKEFTKITNISLKEIIESTQDNDKPTFYVINACRSLSETPNTNSNFGQQVAANSGAGGASANSISHITEEVVSNVATSMVTSKVKPKKYTEINLRKHSGQMISLIDNLCKNENNDGCTNLNINNINNLRVKKGLPPINLAVVNYETLFRIIKETLEAPKANENDNTVFERRMKASLANFESYVPRENTRATKAIIQQVNIAKEEAVKMEEQKKVALKEDLEKRRKILKSKIKDLKFYKPKNYMSEVKIKEDELKKVLNQLNSL